MMASLNIVTPSDAKDTITHVSHTLFRDGTVSWARIVSLVAFGVSVSQVYYETQGEAVVLAAGGAIATYLLANHEAWLLHNGSWVCCT